jgi:hypothetical protein
MIEALLAGLLQQVVTAYFAPDFPFITPFITPFVFQ